MNDVEETLWELKQAAKWSLGVEDRVRAVKEIARAYRGQGIPTLAEISVTAVHGEIRAACEEAIRSVGASNPQAPKRGRPAIKSRRKKAGAKRTKTRR